MQRLLDRFEPSARQWTAVVFGAALVVFLHTTGHGFVLDDGALIVQNEHIRSLSNLPTIFASNAWAGAGLDNSVYRPLTSTTFALNYVVFGAAPWSYHLVNVILHALVSALLFRLALAWGLARNTAGLAAVIFAVHPIHVEAVANVAGRKELLAATFVLLTLLAHGRALRRGGAWLAVAPLLFLAGMLSKETGAVAAGFLPLQDLLLRRRGFSRTEPVRPYVLYASYGLLLVAFLVLRSLVLGTFAPARIPFVDNPLAHASAYVRVLTAIGVIGRGLALLLAPVRLSPDYSFDAIPAIEGPFDPWFLLTALALAGAALAALRLRETQPILLFCLAWYAVAILPAANVLFPVGTIFGERLLYLPSAAFSVLLALSVQWGSRAAPRLFVSLALLGVLLLGIRSVTYAAVWVDEYRLFDAAVHAVPSSTKARYNRGTVRKARGDLRGAIEDFDEAIRIHPRHARAFANRGNARREAGDPAGAMADLSEAIRLDPTDAIALNTRGLLLRLRGDPKAAIADLDEALRLDPEYAEAYLNRGLALQSTGDWDGALRDYLSAIRAAPPQWRHQRLASDLIDEARARRRRDPQAAPGTR